MNILPSFPNDRPFQSERWDAVPLYRWWRQSVVGTVDHQKVITRIIDESGLTARYIFMTMMSAGIAVLGLLLSSPAVVIGAMLISPLMGPILGLGFGLALFDFAELKRAGIAFLAGTIAAALFTALIVLCSPLKGTTAEILARTRPNLFDLLVALFAALAGTFAIIRGRGDTIVGVAIATALMPPIAVVGYGLATWNLPVLGGSFALFATNFMTIALAGTIMARLYGFGHFLSSKQSLWQTFVLLGAFIGMAVPLGLSLSSIAREALITNQVRASLVTQFGPNSRVTQLDVDFSQNPMPIRAVVIAPRDRAIATTHLSQRLQDQLGRKIALQVDEILIDPEAGTTADQVSLDRANAGAAAQPDIAREIVAMVSVASGASPETITLDRERQRVVAAAAPLPGGDLAAYRALEQRTAAAAEGWTIQIAPPAAQMPQIAFGWNSSEIDDAARRAVQLSAWAAQRWNMTALGVPGLPEGDAPENPNLTQRRALAVAAILREAGVTPRPAPGGAQSFRLTTPETAAP